MLTYLHNLSGTVQQQYFIKVKVLELIDNINTQSRTRRTQNNTEPNWELKLHAHAHTQFKVKVVQWNWRGVVGGRKRSRRRGRRRRIGRSSWGRRRAFGLSKSNAIEVQRVVHR